jgi:hypothetical protein
LIVDGALDDCVRQFMTKPVSQHSQHHLYEIHTAPQGELISPVLSAKYILEIARLRDNLHAAALIAPGGAKLVHALLMRSISRSRNVVRMLAATLVPEHCSSGHCGELCRWSHLVSFCLGQRNR